MPGATEVQITAHPGCGKATFAECLTIPNPACQRPAIPDATSFLTHRNHTLGVIRARICNQNRFSLKLAVNHPVTVSLVIGCSPTIENANQRSCMIASGVPSNMNGLRNARPHKNLRSTSLNEASPHIVSQFS